MKLKFTNGASFLLPDNIEPSERLVEINKVLESELIFDGRTMTVEGYLRETWNKPTTITTLDRIGYYLSKMPEQDGQHDLEVLSKNDELEMNKGVRWKTASGERVLGKARYSNFTDLSTEDRAELGLIDTKSE
jgi:hypothetical protein